MPLIGRPVWSRPPSSLISPSPGAATSTSRTLDTLTTTAASGRVRPCNLGRRRPLITVAIRLRPGILSPAPSRTFSVHRRLIGENSL